PRPSALSGARSRRRAAAGLLRAGARLLGAPARLLGAAGLRSPDLCGASPGAAEGHPVSGRAIRTPRRRHRDRIRVGVDSESDESPLATRRPVCLLWAGANLLGAAGSGSADLCGASAGAADGLSVSARPVRAPGR